MYMKIMRKNFIIITLVSIALMLSGCEKLKDLMTLTINTKFEAEFPINLSEYLVKSGDSPSQNNLVDFDVTETIKIEENFDIEPYIKKIKEINLKKIEVTVTGLKEGEIVNSISLHVKDIGHIVTLNNITPDNNVFTLNVPQSTLDEAASILLNTKEITITVSGNATESIFATVGVSIDAAIIAYLLN